MKVQEYKTTEDVTFWLGAMDSKVLPKGSFVKPIEYQYLPKHILEHRDWVGIDRKMKIFCYCSLGIVPVDRSKIREA